MTEKAILIDRANCGVAAFAEKPDKWSGAAEHEIVRITHERTEATNGHILVRIPLPLGADAKEFPTRDGMGAGFDGEVQIAAEKVAAIGKRLLKKPSLPILGMAHVGKANGTAVIVATDLESDHKVTGAAEVSRFLDTEMVMKGAGKGRTVIIQAKYLKMIADFALRYGSEPRPSVCLEIQEDEGAPIFFDVHLDGEERKATGAVMPIRR